MKYSFQEPPGLHVICCIIKGVNNNHIVIISQYSETSQVQRNHWQSWELCAVWHLVASCRLLWLLCRGIGAGGSSYVPGQSGPGGVLVLVLVLNIWLCYICHLFLHGSPLPGEDRDDDQQDQDMAGDIQLCYCFHHLQIIHFKLQRPIFVFSF